MSLEECERVEGLRAPAGQGILGGLTRLASVAPAARRELCAVDCAGGRHVVASPQHLCTPYGARRQRNIGHDNDALARRTTAHCPRRAAQKIVRRHCNRPGIFCIFSL